MGNPWVMLTGNPYPCPRVRVSTGVGAGGARVTHGLPMSCPNCKPQLRRWLAIVLEWELIMLLMEVHTNSDKWVNNNLLDQIYPYANHGGQYHSTSVAS